MIFFKLFSQVWDCTVQIVHARVFFLNDLSLYAALGMAKKYQSDNKNKNEAVYFMVFPHEIWIYHFFGKPVDVMH